MEVEEGGETELSLRRRDLEAMGSIEDGQEEEKDTESNVDILDVMETDNQGDDDRGNDQSDEFEESDDNTEQLEPEQQDGEEKGTPEEDKEEPDEDKEVPDEEKGGKKPPRLVPFPLARVKSILKSDPDVSLISQDSVFLITKATELFVRYLGNECFQQTQASKRKVIQGKDLNYPLKHNDCLMFLEGCLD